MATNPTLPDNRLRLPAGPIDFATEVGDTGQDHDGYPQAGTQPRYDWMRMYLIALLSQQSSYEEPSQYREGTPWFDLNEMALKIRKNGQWVPFAQAVLIEDGYTLADFYNEYSGLGLSAEMRFDGTAAATSNTIVMPTDIAAATAGKENLQADVFINGLLIDPDHVGVSAGQVDLSGGEQVVIGDTYVVVIRNVISAQQVPYTLVSPDGTRYVVTVDNAGTLGTTAI